MIAPVPVTVGNRDTASTMCNCTRPPLIGTGTVEPTCTLLSARKALVAMAGTALARSGAVSVTSPGSRCKPFFRTTAGIRCGPFPARR